MTYTANPNKAKNWASARQAAENVLKEIWQNRKDVTIAGLTIIESTKVVQSMLPYMNPVTPEDLIEMLEEFSSMFEDFWQEIEHNKIFNIDNFNDVATAFYVDLGQLEGWYQDVKEELIDDNSSDEILLERSLIDARHELKKVNRSEG